MILERCKQRGLTMIFEIDLNKDAECSLSKLLYMNSKLLLVKNVQIRFSFKFNEIVLDKNQLILNAMKRKDINLIPIFK